MKYNIYVVGCGATGSNVIQNISQLAMFEKNIVSVTLIDKDIVEEKNFRNQRFSQKDIYKNKAQVLSTRYRKLGININYIDEFVTDSDKFVSLIHSNEEIPLIISCVDNNQARRVLNDVFKKLDTCIYIDAGNGAKSRRGQVVVSLKQDNKIIQPPIADVFPEIMDESHDHDDDEPLITYHCVNAEKHPQNISTNILSATIVFNEVTNIIEFNSRPRNVILFDAEKILVK